MKALELADMAETTLRPGGLADEVARELRRLAEVNAELVTALEYAESWFSGAGLTHTPTFGIVAAALFRAKENQ